jgi:hypothetical protein
MTGSSEPRGDLAGLALAPFCFERFDEINCREEADTLFVALDVIDVGARTLNFLRQYRTRPK